MNKSTDGQMSLSGIDLLEWQYHEDNGNVMCRCPECGKETKE